MVSVGAHLVKTDIVKPGCIDRPHTALLNIPESEEVSANVVENAVQHHADTVLVQGITDLLEARVISQTTVDLFVVDGIVSVAGAFKNRVEHNAVHAHFLEVGDKVIDFIQTVIQLKIVLFRSAAESQWIDIVNNGVMNPMH